MILLEAAAEQGRTLRDIASKGVITHYCPWMPISPRDGSDPGNDTGQYWDSLMTPQGGGGSFSAMGGLHRDRPLPGDVISGLAGTTLQKQDAALRHDMDREVADMIAAGLNGAAVDVVEIGNPTSRNYRNVHHLLDAAWAADHSFRVFIMPDMTGAGGVSMAQSVFVNAILDFSTKPSAARTPAGRVIVAPFTPETKPPSFYEGCAAALASSGVAVSWLWCLQDYPANVDKFYRVANTVGVGLWGEHSLDGAGRDELDARQARNRKGQRWINPVAPQDVRYRDQIYDESHGTRMFDRGWRAVIAVAADYAQLVTWNDLAEGTHIRPSLKNQRGWLELNKLYSTWFRDGKRPAVAQDYASLTHRTMHLSSPLNAGSPQTLLANLRGGSNPTVNIVEVKTILTSPGVVVATIGGVEQVPYWAPTGETVRDFPIDTTTEGAPSVKVFRDGAEVLSLVSRNAIDPTPDVQDPAYYITATPLVLAVDNEPEPPASNGLVTALVEAYI
jgi:hypothetical protein